MLILLRYWKLIGGLLIVLTLLGTAKYWMHRAEKAEYAAKVCEVARQVQIGLWKSEIDRLTRDLANADTAAKVAIAAKVEAEKAAAKKLQAERKEWERIYGSKPENRKWADSPLPADVAGRLRDHGG